MIKSFEHKGLERFYRHGRTSGIQSNHIQKLKIQLTALDAAEKISDLRQPGWKLRSLKGPRKGIWSIKVNGNWRLTFKFEKANVYLLNYEDYH